MHQFLQYLRQGHAATQAAKQAEEVNKIGVLRGGNAGIVVQGKWYGKCGRVSALRALGLDLPPDSINTLDQFEYGFANEDIIAKLLTNAGVKFKREDDTPVAWTTTNGVQVTGRPDIVLQGPDGTNSTVVELKSVVSIWSAIGKHYDLRPDSTNLIQTAHYSWQLGNIPGALVYSNRGQFHLSTAPKWLQAKFGPGVYDVEYKSDKPTEPMKLLPFNRVYDLTWRDNKLYYHTDGMSKPEPTIITPQAIESYYTQVAGYIQGKAPLPPRPEPTSVDLSKSYKACQYCPLSDTCDQYEEQPDIWRDEAELKVQQLQQQFSEALAK